MPILSLEDAKAYLRFPNPSQPHQDDAIILDLINGIEEVVTFNCGPVTPVQYIEKYDGGAETIHLWNKPIIDVIEVLESWGYVQFSLDQVDADTSLVTSIYAYSIDNAETGEITRRSAGGVSIPFVNAIRDGIQVTYTAGRQTVPAAVKIGCCELLVHLYQGSLQRGVSLSGSSMTYDAVSGGIIHNPADGSQIWVGLPTRLLQFFESESRMPIIA